MKHGPATQAMELIASLDEMTVHRGRESPAPHKPIMILWAIHRRMGGERPRLFTYSEAHEPIAQLLEVAGRRPRPWYPFIRLRRESFWEFHGDPALNSAGDIRTRTDLNDPAIKGGFLSKYNSVLLDSGAAEEVATFVGERWLSPAIRKSVMNHLRETV